MSIRPEHSARIFSGEKRFELRRGRVLAKNGDLVWVYESAPTMALVGAFVVRRVLFEDLDVLWQRHGRWFGISRQAYAAYFRDRELGCAIEVAEASRVESISLVALRRHVAGFRPPQSYQWCRPELARVLPSSTLRRLGHVPGAALAQ